MKSRLCLLGLKCVVEPSDCLGFVKKYLLFVVTVHWCVTDGEEGLCLGALPTWSAGLHQRWCFRIRLLGSPALREVRRPHLTQV